MLTGTRATWRVALLLAAASLSGCNVFGPASIATGRAVYNEVINTTEDEELLNMIVRERYDDTYGMLAVSSVTANIRASAKASADVGVGPSDNYVGNLVPLAGGVAFEDNPTISYVPRGGEQFLQQFLAPLSLEELLLLGRASKRERASLINVFVRSVNGVENPLIATDADPEMFQRTAGLWMNLRAAYAVKTGRDANGQFFMLFQPENAEEAANCNELLEIYRVEARAEAGAQLRVSLEPAAGQLSPNVIQVETASVLEIIRAAGDSIDVPQEHYDAGVVAPAHPGVQGREFVRIHVAKKAPKNESVAIQYRGLWYYIADSDSISKQHFSLMRTLVGMRLFSASDQQTKPVLTIPVG